MFTSSNTNPKLNWKWTGCFSNGNVWKETIGPTICSLCFRNITRYFWFQMCKIHQSFFSLVVSSWLVSQVCWSISLYSTLAELPFTFRIQRYLPFKLKKINFWADEICLILQIQKRQSLIKMFTQLQVCGFYDKVPPIQAKK